MMPGMKLKTEKGSPEKQSKDGGGREEEEVEPALPTPRKRLINFKIPLVRGSQRRDQQQSAVARIRLNKEELQGLCGDRGLWVRAS